MTDPSSSSEIQARDALHALLCSMFPGDGRDLRRFARGDPACASMVDSVAWTAGLDAIVHEFIERCEARGFVDEALFRRLLRIRPHRHPDIAFTAQRWGYSISAAPLTRPVPRRYPARPVVGSLALIGLAALAVALLPLWPRSAEQDPRAAERSEEAPPVRMVAPIPTAPGPPNRDTPIVSPDPQSIELAARPPEPRAKAASSNRCLPSSKLERIAQLKLAGREGGPLHHCWLEFWAQSTIRARDCPVHLQGASARRSTLTFTNPKQRVHATVCLSTMASSAFRAVNDCTGPVDHTFMLAEIEPQ